MNWFKEEFGRIDRSPRALRRFGLVLGAMSILLGLVLLARHRNASLLFVLAALLLAAAFFAPAALKYLHALWMSFSLLLGWVMTRVILTIVFCLVVTPIGLLQRLFRQSNLDLGFRTGASTYWRPREKSLAPADYRNQF